MDLTTLVLIVMALLAGLMGLSLCFGGRLDKRIMSFLGIVFSAAGWAFFIAMFLMADDESLMLPFAILYYVFAAGIAISSLLFAMAYAGRLDRKKVLLLIIPFVALSLAMICKPDLLIKGFSSGPNGENIVVLGSMFYNVYVVYFLIYYIAAGFVWGRMLSAENNSGKRQKSVLRVVFFGYAVAGIVGGTFNLILPWIGNYLLIWLGPVSVFLFVVINYVAIIRYRLFDIKSAIIRFLSYCIIVSCITVVYLFVFNTVFRSLFGIDVSDEKILVIIITMVILVLMILPTVNRLNSLLNSLFHTDNYNIFSLVEKLNKTIIKVHRVEDLLKQNARLVNGALKTSFTCFVSTVNSDHGPAIVAGFPKKSMRNDEIEVLNKFVDNCSGSVVFADSLMDNDEVSEVLKRHRVAVIADIKYTPDRENDSQESSMGYILFGYKKQRRGFVQKDIDAVEAISSLTAIAIENVYYYSQVQKFNESLRDEVRAATRSLKMSNRKLKKLDLVKDEFVNMASHQLRTPLTSIKGYISMMLDGDAGELNASQKKFLDEAYYSCNKMVHIVNDFLDVSRLQTGKFIVERTWVRLDRIVKEEVDNLYPVAKTAGIKLNYEVQEHVDYSLNIDESKIRQVVSNIIDNAIYYSRGEKSILVRLEGRDGKVMFEVIDSGIGVPKKEQKRLFKKFYRASNARKRRPDGTGVGLFLAKKIITALKGGMIFHSVEGKGSTFGFWLGRDK